VSGDRGRGVGMTRQCKGGGRLKVRGRVDMWTGGQGGNNSGLGEGQGMGLRGGNLRLGGFFT